MDMKPTEDYEIGVTFFVGDESAWGQVTKLSLKSTTFAMRTNMDLQEVAMQVMNSGLIDPRTNVWYPPHVIQFIRKV